MAGCSGDGRNAPGPTATPRRRSPPPLLAAPAAAAVLSALLLLLTIGGGGSGPEAWPALRTAYGSLYTGTNFPFETCIQEQRNSRYYATLYSYRENRPQNTSTLCIQIHVLASCTPGRFRCCNTGINKLKLFPGGGMSTAVAGDRVGQPASGRGHQGGTPGCGEEAWKLGAERGGPSGLCGGQEREREGARAGSGGLGGEGIGLP
jgi:hypothetical protein